MGRKMHKVVAEQSSDIVIDLLVRHAGVPTSDDLLERYSRTYSGKPAGYARPVALEPEPLEIPAVVPDSIDDIPAFPEEAVMGNADIEVPPADYEALEEVIAAAGDDTDNDYDVPGATVAMDAIDVPVESETMIFDAAEIDAMAGAVPAEPVEAVEEVEAVETAEAVEAPESDTDVEYEGDENATVMMGAVDEAAVGASQDDAASRARKKKRRHR